MPTVTPSAPASVLLEHRADDASNRAERQLGARRLGHPGIFELCYWLLAISLFSYTPSLRLLSAAARSV